MRFLNFLPFAAALVAAAPAAEPPTKDLARRDAEPCVDGCFNPNPPDKHDKYDKPDITKDEILGVVVYDIIFERTLEFYEVTFSTYNPNTQYYTTCHSAVQDAKDFQRCERMRTAFIVNIDDKEIVEKETATVYVKLVWEYAEAALPRAVKRKKGEPVNEDELKGIFYYQVGELQFLATCTKVTKMSTIGDGNDSRTTEDDGMVYDRDGYCHAPYDDHTEDRGVEIVKSEAHVKCHFEGELTAITLVLKRGKWDGKSHD